MKRLLAGNPRTLALIVAGLMALTGALTIPVARADDPPTPPPPAVSEMAPLTSETTQEPEAGVAPGALTSRNSLAWKLFSFPLRLATGTIGLGLGALEGGYRGMMEMGTRSVEETLGRPNRDVTLIPNGAVGVALAAPMGAATGAPPRAKQGAREGWRWWDRF